MNEDEYVTTSFTYNAAASELQIHVRAKRSVTLTEVQGDRSVVDAFGASMPDGYFVRAFGEGVEVPEGMKDDVNFMNQSQFRWACNIPIAAGSEHTIRMPASGGPGREKGVLTLAYAYTKLLGLFKGEGAVYVALAPSKP